MNTENIEEERYNKNGEFIPYGSSTGNINGELAHLRNTYLTAEKDYFLKLLENKGICQYLMDLINEPAEVLFNLAIEIQNKLETGNLEDETDLKLMASMSPEEKDKHHMKNLEIAEGKMCLLFAAASDKVKILELIKSRYVKNKEENTMENGFSMGGR